MNNIKPKILQAKGISFGRRLGLGDMVERIAHPIAVKMKLPCLDPIKQTLRPDSPCAKRRDKLNKLGQKIGIGSPDFQPADPKPSSS